MLVNVPRLITACYTEAPDPAVPAQRVAFGTSGHRGTAFNRSFNEGHILAITQATCARVGRSGPALRLHSGGTPAKAYHQGICNTSNNISPGAMPSATW
jgi:phosphoglucomutase